MPSAEVSSPLPATDLKQLQLYDLAAQILKEAPENLPSLPSLPSLPACHLSHHSPRGHLRSEKRFWQFIISDTTTYVTYGTINGDEELQERATQIMRHRSIEAAQEFINEKIEERINHGYVGWAAW
ncbi:2618_t:CDS:1 [Paraglomus occultum]|uniref:2618_t:CDS:1 n=1 Tax=Paraglomus occultum TaxID=144539 RepID=A0A9N8VWF0_9GLOM|nr:2618_t:CDS:1 [Paraglomus occultum]